MTDKSKLTLPANRRHPAGRHPKAPQTREPYVATDELTTAVNLAIYLRRPLLLEGDAGCGKSRLARHVAYELGLPLFEWPVRSTSRARDGLYTYDSILRLHDVQLPRHAPQAVEDGDNESGRSGTKRDPENPLDYVTFGALGRAFKEKDCPAVVLIDEIDKADIDFPNDLLTVLDDPWKFEIHEADEPSVQAKHPPIVIITSNKEKGNLPAPFLRRCIYHYIEFPSDSARLKAIVDAHYGAGPDRGQVTPLSAELVEAATVRFLDIRAKGDLYKKPGTSEFLDWLEALRGFCGLRDLVTSLRDADAKLIYPDLLFKLRADWQRYAQRS
jgi:MoxR-like ATPase